MRRDIAIAKMLKRKFVEGYIVGHYEAQQGLECRYKDVVGIINKWIAKKYNKNNT